MIGWLLMKGAQTAIGAASNKANEKAQAELASATKARISAFIEREKSALIVKEPERYSDNQVINAKRLLIQQDSASAAEITRQQVIARVRESAELAAEAERKRLLQEELAKKQAAQLAEAKVQAEMIELKKREALAELEKARQAEDWAKSTVAKSDADPLDLLKARKILELLAGANE